MQEEVEYMKVTRLWYACKCDGRPQWRIAAACGFSAPALSAYVHMRVRIPQKHLYRLCEVLGRDQDELIGTMYISTTDILTGAFNRT